MAQNITQLTDYTLPRTSYATFDALSLKQLIIDRLTQGGIFTDQVYEGSNISALNDVIALSYHYLLFYLNSTSSESMFDQTLLYQNMNRLVKLIGYSPTGYQTALLTFQANANASLPANIYTIPRYSYFTVNGIYYSFVKDVTFSKTSVTGTEDLTSLYNESLLYQGKYIEYPAQVATGEPFETFTLVVTDNVTNQPINIDQGSINVYIQDASTGAFSQYNLTNSVFLEDSSSLAYECRYNENGYYELKFGNGVFGHKLNAGDTLYVYYLQSDGAAGVISTNQLNNNTLNFFATPQFNTLSPSILNQSLNYITPTLASYINFTNNVGSSQPNAGESVQDIRTNAPKTFYSQNRLITESDFETFLKSNFSNIVLDSKAINNRTYIENVIKYFYDMGITRPNMDARVLFNEVNFAHAGQDNNIYLYMVPTIQTVDSNNNQYFLQNSQKNAIITSMVNNKALNMELIPQDPIYTAFTLGFALPGEAITTDIASETYLVIKKDSSILVDPNMIISNVNSIFVNYFAAANCNLGQLINLSDLVTQILSVQGVSNFSMQRTASDGTTVTLDGLSLLVFNPKYSSTDIQIINTNLQLPFFKFPFLYNQSISNNIIVV